MASIRMRTAERDPYPDALRACALLVVVLGHWIATLPRLVDGQLADTDHLLAIWDAAGVLTWVVQVVPLFVFVSAAVSADGVLRRVEQGGQARWWAGRALGLARPTVTYLAVLVALAAFSLLTGGRLLGVFNQSLTIHLWFLLMLLTVQALLPWCLRLDDRFEPMSDARVRKAMALAIDRDAIAESLLRTGVRPAWSWVSPGIGDYPGITTAAETMTPDTRRTEAVRLLAEAGFEDVEALEFLLRIDMDYAQGFVLGRPQPIESWLTQGVQTAALVEARRRVSTAITDARARGRRTRLPTPSSRGRSSTAAIRPKLRMSMTCGFPFSECTASS